MNPRNLLPGSNEVFYLSDGGIETDLIFNEGIDLPYFAAFPLLDDETGMEVLRAYYLRFAAIARRRGMGFLLESPTWRAGPDWGAQLGYDRSRITTFNLRAIELMRELETELRSEAMSVVVSGCIGPRGDGYDPGAVMTAGEAERYHALQVRAFAEAGADLVSAITMTNTGEAVGIARAALAVGVPSVISFTVETDGRLPTGESLADAINTVEEETGGAPAYYMVNCAHPTHFDQLFQTDEAWIQRIGGIRANASRLSHAELDEAEELDAGNPTELGQQYAGLRRLLPSLAVVGGCCGTDVRHIEAIATALG